MAKFHNDILYQSIQIDTKELCDLIAKLADKAVGGPKILPRYIRISQGDFVRGVLTIQYSVNFNDIRREVPGTESAFDVVGDNDDY